MAKSQIEEKKAQKTMTLASAEVQSLVAEVAEKAKEVPEIVKILNKDQLLNAEADLLWAKKTIKTIEATEKTITKPMDDAKKATKAFFQPHIEKLKDLSSALSKGMIRYQELIEKKRREKEEAERVKLLEEVSEQADSPEEAQEMVNEVMAQQVSKPAPLSILEGSNVRTLWEIEITDASKLPREFLIPDMTKLNAVARAMKQDTNIPGARAVSKKTIASSGRG